MLYEENGLRSREANIVNVFGSSSSLATMIEKLSFQSCRSFYASLISINNSNFIRSFYSDNIHHAFELILVTLRPFLSVTFIKQLYGSAIFIKNKLRAVL